MDENKVCPRCGVVHNSPPVDPDKIIRDHARSLSEQIDREVLAQVGAWMDSDKNYSIGTQEAYDEFVRKRNYPIPRVNTEKP